MKLKNNSMLKKVGKDYMILPLSDHNVSLDLIFNTNEVGAFIYNLLKNETTKDEIVAAILKEYEVEESIARNDLDEFIENLISKGLLEE